MIMSLDGMDCFADLQGRYPRDGDVLLVLLLHLVLFCPFHARQTYRHWSGYMRSNANDEPLGTASCTSSNGSQT